MITNVEEFERFIQTKNALFKDQYVEGSVEWYIKWYQRRSPKRRIGFRFAGISILLISLSLPPTLALIPDSSKALIATIASWVMAIIGGVNTFFNWQQVWQSYIEAEMTLRHIQMQYQIEMTVARSFEDENEGLNYAIKVTEEYANKVFNTITSETQKFYEHIEFPHVENGN